MAAYLNPTELRNGTVYKENGSTFVVLRYEHIKKGRGRATIRVRVKDIVKESNLEKTYTDGDRLEVADISRRNSQFLYKDQSKLYFMDQSDYAQIEFKLEDYNWEANFLKEGTMVQTIFLDGIAVAFELPASIELTITYTEPATAGDSATGAMKNATTDTGYELKVPLFIKIDDVIKVRTEDGIYLSRI